jgi:hypothetical protein
MQRTLPIALPAAADDGYHRLRSGRRIVMILAALALFSNAAVGAPVVRAAIAVIPPPSLQSPRGIPKAVTTGVRIMIGADGRIDRCSVVSSSGWPKLDMAVCAILARSWIEEEGGGAADADRRPGTHEISISWTPPRY